MRALGCHTDACGSQIDKRSACDAALLTSFLNVKRVKWYSQ